MATEGSILALKEEVHAFVIRSMAAVGLTEKHACVLADLLLSADYRGHVSHGLNKLGNLLYKLIYLRVVYTLYPSKLKI